MVVGNGTTAEDSAAFTGNIQHEELSIQKIGAGKQTLGGNLTAANLTVSEGELEVGGTFKIGGTTTVDGHLHFNLGQDVTNGSLDGAVKGTGTITLNGGVVGNAIFINGSAAEFTGTLISEYGYVSLDETSGRKLSDSGLTLAGGVIHNGNNSPNIQSPVFLKEGTTSGLMSGWGNSKMENSKFTTISGVISGAGALQIFADSGTKVLANTNTYTGGTIIGGVTQAGQGNKVTLLRLDAPNALGTGPVRFGLNDAEVNLNGNSQNFGGLSSETYTGTKITNSGEAVSLTFSPADGDFVYSGTLPELANVTKTGAGSQTLTNLNASGTTTVEQGTLTLAGSSTLNDVVMKGGALAEAPNSEITLVSGSTVSIVPSGEFVQIPGLDFTNSVLQITIAEDSLYSQFDMIGAPEFNENQGFLNISIETGVEPADAGYLISKLCENFESEDFNSWLLEEDRANWNLAWVNGQGLMLTALGSGGGGDGSAVPEPASVTLLILGLGLLGFHAVRSRKVK